MEAAIERLQQKSQGDSHGGPVRTETKLAVEVVRDGGFTVFM